MREIHVLNLGAGTQSTVLYLLACRTHRHEPHAITFDAAVFADTKAEPRSVYHHVEWLKRQRGPMIYCESRGNLEKDLIKGVNSLGAMTKPGKKTRVSRRFASIPAFTALPPEERKEGWREGRVPRQCTREYKTDVVQWVIRRRMLGLKYRQRFPKDVKIHQYFGFSTEELGRMKRLQDRFAADIPWAAPHFPLIEWGMSRRDCKAWLAGRVPHVVQRSACVFCPYKDDTEWADLKTNHPEEWDRAVSIDRALRMQGAVSGRGVEHQLYLHRSCTPLEVIDLSAPVPNMLDQFSTGDCLGMCGN